METSVVLNSSIPKFDWLYPELLSKDGLVAILSQRYVRLPEDIDRASKDELLELYYRYIIPRPQRKYRLNRRGREMTVKQIAQAKKRKITAPYSSQPPAKRVTAESTSSSFDGCRLKPPPSCVNFEKKVVKLGSSLSSTLMPNVLSSLASNHHKQSALSITPGKVIHLGQSPVSSSILSKSPNVTKSSDDVKKTVKEICSDAGKLLTNGANVNVTRISKKDEVMKKTDEPMDTDQSGGEASSGKKKKIARISWP